MDKTYPSWAYLPGRGECYIMDYLGNGTFYVRTMQGERIFANRNDLRFLVLPKPVTTNTPQEVTSAP